MSFTDAMDLATYPAFVRRVTAATVRAAVSVGAEEYDGSQYKILRRALATNVLHDPVEWGVRFTYGVTANVAISINSVDGDIEFTVNSLWDAMAGAFQASS
jgi:hypothetical protein